MEKLTEWLANPLAHTLGGLLALVLLAWLVATVARRALVRAFRAFAARTAWTWDDVLVEHGVLRQITRIAPTLIAQFGIGFVPGVPDKVDLLVRNVAMSCTILFLMLAMGAVLNALEDIYSRRSEGRRSIKSYVQFIKIAIYIVGAVVIVATLIDRSPLILLSGLGALSAILLLVFKDTILGFVAGVQLTTNDMLHVGDWIEVPAAGADGDVIDIALHTVKVQNFDKTITTIPTWKLITDPFRNWRGMSEAGGRRIKRSLLIDAGSVHFINDEDITRMTESLVLRDYLKGKASEVSSFNVKLGEAGRYPLNLQRLTNLGTFRAYAVAYLKAHPGIRQDMTLIVRQLDARGEGIPLELYCFTRTTAWSEYEGILSDIFDHLIAILPEFGLRLFQKPAGGDLRDALGERARKLEAEPESAG
ncbi:mechanosensitive ion channel family protein [Dokdonella sp.]|uniref:mechanosensitive ion channel family protein n=1 Tax=Dokdonella sp. TaxID=2291710 RepID=UPI003526EEE3